MNNKATTEQLITITEAARTIGVSNDTMRRWERDGRIKSIRFVHNGKRFYRKEDIENIIRNGATK